MSKRQTGGPRLTFDKDQGQEPQRPIWPAPGYDVATEIIDRTNWVINPDAALPSLPASSRRKGR